MHNTTIQKLLGKIGAHCVHELFFTSVIITKNVKAEQSVIAGLQSRKETYNSKREKTREDKVMTMKGRIKKNNNKISTDSSI